MLDRITVPAVCATVGITAMIRVQIRLSFHTIIKGEGK